MGEINISKEFLTFFTAMLPILELRGAIPLAIGKLGVSPEKAYALSVIGNMMPVIPLLLLLKIVSNWLKRYKLGEKFFTWLFARTRRHSVLVEKYEALGLVLFVAVPLPITGAWTGCVAAFLFGIRFKYAFPAIFLGVLIAGVIVTLASLGIISIFS